MTSPTVYDGLTGIRTPVVTGSSAEGVRVIRCHNLTLDSPVVKNCAGGGILDYGVDYLSIVDPDIRSNGRSFVPDSSGRDTQGSGIIIQGAHTRITGGYVADNGNETTLEHGVYVSKLARWCVIDDTVILRNAASGLKLDGHVEATRLVIAGSPRGVVLGINVPTGYVAKLTDSDISGTTYAVMAEKGANMSRFDLNDNRYPKGSRFRLPDGFNTVGLAEWKRQTGLDSRSVEA